MATIGVAGCGLLGGDKMATIVIVIESTDTEPAYLEEDAKVMVQTEIDFNTSTVSSAKISVFNTQA